MIWGPRAPWRRSVNARVSRQDYNHLSLMLSNRIPANKHFSLLAGGGLRGANKLPDMCSVLSSLPGLGLDSGCRCFAAASVQPQVDQVLRVGLQFAFLNAL